MSKPEYREAQRTAYCRSCDKAIKRGEMMVSLYSFRNTGQSIHICPLCVKEMFLLIPKGE